MISFFYKYWLNSSTLFKGTIYLSLGQLFFFLSSYITHIFLGRSLGPANYGAYSLVISIITIANLVVTTGIPRATSKFISENPKNIINITRTSFGLQAILSLLVSIIFILISPGISVMLRDRAISRYFYLSTLIIPFYAVYSLINNIFNGIRDYKKQALVQILFYLGKIFFIILLALIYKSVASAIIGFSLSPIIAILIGIIVFPKTNKLNRKEKFSKSKIINFATPIIIFSVLTHLLYSLDMIFLKYISKDNMIIGFYSAASNLAKIISFLPVPISFVIFPAISRSNYINNNEKTKNYMKKSYLYLILPIFLVLAIFLSFGEQIVTVLFTSEYLPSVGLFKILSIAMGFYALYILSQIIISGINKPSINIFIAIFALIIYVFSNLLLIPNYQAAGAAYSTLITSFTGFILSALYIYKRVYK